MWPLGTYDRMVREIKDRENKDIPVTFGILIADYNQQLSKEYILNYIDRFNYKSDKYINFYLPGYLEESFSREEDVITINGKKYYFDRVIYQEFLQKLELDFEIQYPYNPILILIEYNKGYFNKSKKIIIELDSNDNNIKRTGELFEKIFLIAKKEVDIVPISKKLQQSERNMLNLDTIIQVIDNNFISAIYNYSKNTKKYKLIEK